MFRIHPQSFYFIKQEAYEHREGDARDYKEKDHAFHLQASYEFFKGFGQPLLHDFQMPDQFESGVEVLDKVGHLRAWCSEQLILPTHELVDFVLENGFALAESSGQNPMVDFRATDLLKQFRESSLILLAEVLPHESHLSILELLEVVAEFQVYEDFLLYHFRDQVEGLGTQFLGEDALE